MPMRRAGVVSRDLFLADEAAVAKHDDAVGDAENFIETVRDIDHADAAGLERAHRGEQPLDLIGRQACGGLVENQEVAVDAQGARDGDKRFLGPAQRLDAGVRIEVAADQAQRVSSRFRRSAQSMTPARPKNEERAKPRANPTFSATVIHSMRPRS